MNNPTANVLHGRIKRLVHNPPYVLATIELDPNVPQEITVSYIPTAPASARSEAAEATAPQTAAGETATQPAIQPDAVTSPPPPPAQGDKVAALVPVPGAVIVKGF